ncbi:hypothetical protein AERO8C_140056 [Aeromonas veronii]|uniref:Uncharacterized protein n=1 Tax=Aeromonas veronii TaxID=654 RepID=A0A653KVN2_AERVE|nr:hypothetical protein AERO8C_140056 [Aeromonas veronii]
MSLSAPLVQGYNGRTFAVLMV